MSRSKNPNVTIYYSLIILIPSVLIFCVYLSRKSKRKMIVEGQCGRTVFCISETVARTVLRFMPSFLTDDF